MLDMLLLLSVLDMLLLLSVPNMLLLSVLNIQFCAVVVSVLDIEFVLL